MIIFEFVISFLLCCAIGYFFLLSSPPDEEDETNAGSKQQQPVSRFPFCLLEWRYWNSLLTPYLHQDSTLGLVLRAIVFFVTGEETFSYDFYPLNDEELELGIPDEERSPPSRSRRPRERSITALEKNPKHPNGKEQRHAESASWVNLLFRLGVYIFLGGGSLAHDVYVDRVRYAIEKGIQNVNTKLDPQPHSPPNQLGDDWRSSRPIGVRQCLLRLLHLELGKGFSNMTTTTTDAGETSFNLPNSHNNGLSGISGPEYALPINVEADTVTASTARSTAAVEDPWTNSASPVNAVGVSFPRLAGDIISVEVLPEKTVSTAAAGGGGGGGSPLLGSPHSSTVGHTGTGAGGAAGTTTKRGRPVKPVVIESVVGRGDSTVGAEAPSPYTALSRPLRCFTVPLVFEDGQFFLQLGCSLPLFALLNLAKGGPRSSGIPIPGDVLRLDCQLNVKRISFHGNLYLSFCANLLELSFPHTPQFTVKLEVAPPVPGQNTVVEYDVRETAKRFTATSTMHNSVSPPPQWNNPSSSSPARNTGFSASKSNVTSSRSPAAARGRNYTVPKSCINERNEKMEEILFLSVQNAIQEITYPKVLQVRYKPNTTSGAWAFSKETATLPLYN